MAAATPAELKTGPSRTKMRSGSTWISGYSAARRSAYCQWVVTSAPGQQACVGQQEGTRTNRAVAPGLHGLLPQPAHDVFAGTLWHSIRSNDDQRVGRLGRFPHPRIGDELYARGALRGGSVLGHQPDAIRLSSLHLAVCLEKRIADASDFKQMHFAGGEDCDEHGLSSAQRWPKLAHGQSAACRRCVIFERSSQVLPALPCLLRSESGQQACRARRDLPTLFDPAEEPFATQARRQLTTVASS